MKPSASSAETISFTATADLVTRARSGDSEAWTTMVRQFDRLLVSVAKGFRLNPDDAADAVQQTWLRLFENIHKIRQDDRLAGWLSSTMRRECIRTYHRRTGEWLTGDLTDLTFTVADGSDAEVLRADRDRILWDTVEGLPLRQRDLIRRLFDPPTAALSYDEIGHSLGLATGSIGPIRMRALHRLRVLLHERDFDQHALA